VSRLGLRLHADEEHWIPLSDLMTGLMMLFLLISIAYMVEVQLNGVKQTTAQRTYAQSRAALGQRLSAQLAPQLRAVNARFDPATLTLRFPARSVLFPPGSAALPPQSAAKLDAILPRLIAVLREPRYAGIVKALRVEGFAAPPAAATSQQQYVNGVTLAQERARAVLGYAVAMPALRAQRDWLMQTTTTGTQNAADADRVELRVLTAPVPTARVAAATGLHGTAPAHPTRKALNFPPIVAHPMPAYPAFARASIGKPLHAVYPRTSTRCLGYLDGVLLKYVWHGTGAKLYGWGYDLAAAAPVRHVLFADAAGTIVGAGTGGFTRPDVPAAVPSITSRTTGWQGYVGVTSRPVNAWVVLRNGAVCRLGSARPAAGEGI
jgi:outer membrane protein OmpA-like peptidoglycan-associated protein